MKKIYRWALLLGAAIHGVAALAQDPTVSEPLLRIEAGMHTAAVRKISTDAQGRFAVTASFDKTARIWELPSGRLLQVLRAPGSGSGLEALSAAAISPDGEVVVTAGDTRRIQVFDRASGRALRQLVGLANVNRLSFSADGRWLAVSSTLGGVRVWDWRDGLVPLVGGAFSEPSCGASWNKDGQLLVPIFGGKLRLYAVQGGALVLMSEVKVSSGNQPCGIEYSPDGRHVAVGYTDGPWVDVLDAATLGLKFSADTRSIVGGNLPFVAWSHDGQHLIAGGRWSQDGRTQIRRWSQAGQGAYIDIPIGVNSILGMVAWPPGGWLIGSADPTWGILEAGGSWKEKGRPPTADFRPKSDAGDNLVLSADGLKVQFGFAAGVEGVHTFDLRNRLLGNGLLVGGGAALTTGLSIENWFQRKDTKLGGKGLSEPDDVSRSMAVEPGLKGFALGSESMLRYFDREGSLLWRNTSRSPVWGLNIPPRLRVVVAAYGDGTVRWHRLSDGKELLAFFPHADRRRWVLWTPSGYYDASPGGEDLIGWHVNGAGTRKLFVSAILPDSAALQAGFKVDDLIVQFDGKKQPRVDDVLRRIAGSTRGQSMDFMVERAGQTISLNVEPKVSAESARPQIGLGMSEEVDSKGADFFPVSRFRDRFYRPDVIDRVLETLDVDEALAMADVARGNVRPSTTVSLAQVLPPVVELLGGSELRSAEPAITLRVRGRSASDAPVTGWRLRVNGQAVADARNLVVADGDDVQLVHVTIPSQDSEIQVFAESRHGVSAPAVVRVAWTGVRPAPADASSFQILPKLYVLSIGVGQYQHKDVPKLGLAAKDARDFAAAMKGQEKRFYREVEVKLLTDSQATRDEIIDGLDWLQKQVTQHDMGMLFIAGHGTNDPSLGYTFLPVNADPDRLKRTGVGMADIRSTLAALTGKALFFIDTCHAGNVLGAGRRAGPNDISGVINELASAENGVVVFSASTGRQFSLEDPAWGNGAFTKALVEGLRGAATHGGSPRITHKMLDLYISERVKTLTQGRQSPVTQAPGGVPDFPLAIK